MDKWKSVLTAYENRANLAEKTKGTMEFFMKVGNSCKRKTKNGWLVGKSLALEGLMKSKVETFRLQENYF